MSESVEIQGIWKGEYVYNDRFQPSIVKTSIPFMLKIKSLKDSGIFEGMCQDDPVTSKINLAADIYGIIMKKDIFFTKKYPKTLMSDNFGVITTGDEPHPDLIFNGALKDNGQFFGTWSMERTFRKVKGSVVEFPYLSGIWWMKRY